MNGNGDASRPQGRRGAMRGAAPPAPGGRGVVPAAAGRGRGRGAPPPAARDAEKGKSEKGKESPPDGKGSPPEKKSPRSTSEDRLEAQMKLMALAKVELKQRPGLGSAGRKYPIRANHFTLDFKAKTVVVIQQYNVEAIHQRRKMIKDERYVGFWRCIVDNKQTFANPVSLAYDGDHICFTMDRIKFPSGKDEHTFDVENLQLERDDRPCSITVRFRHVGQVALDLQSIRDGLSMGELQTPIQAIDVIFRQARTCTYFDQKFACGGRSFYRPPDERDWARADLGQGRQIWTGFFASAHVASNWRPLMNVDVSNTAYYKNVEVLQFLCEVMEPFERRNRTSKFVPAKFHAGYTLTPDEKRFFEREIRDLRVVVRHTGGEKVYKVNGVTDKSAEEIQFSQKMKDGTERPTNVAQYFADTYGEGLQFPRMPCLHVGSKRKQIYMPMEKCKIKGSQKCAKKLQDTMLAKMIKAVCTDAPTRERTIMNQVHEARLGQDDFVQTFGLGFEPKMVEFQARQLQPPALSYGGGKTTKPMQGEWRTGGGMQFLEGSQVQNYWLFSFLPQSRQPELERFCQQLGRTAQGMGTRLPPFPSVVEYVNNADTLRAAFDKIDKTSREKAGDERPDLIVVAIPVKGYPLYPLIKRVAEVRKGIMTQCVTMKTVSECKTTTLANVILKINAKMGGVNNGIVTDEVFQKFFIAEPTLVLGVDVTHPGPLDTRTPSIASMVGNVDVLPYKYAASIKVQKHRREALVYLGDLVKDRLLAYYKNTKLKPSRILVYRDGVSEGQFKQVMMEEMRGIRNACTSLDETYRPKITFIVVQKRHHTRFFCANPQDFSGRAKNVPPGTVVDTDVVHPVNFDFYLVSHQGLLGTSRPTHYFVLHDDNDFTADEMQRVTFYLAHVYCRCQKSVSIPAPVYYADLACQRARHHLQEKINEMSSDSGSHSGDRPQRRAEGPEGDHSSSTEERELREAVLVVDNAADVRQNEMPLPMRMYFV